MPLQSFNDVPWINPGPTQRGESLDYFGPLGSTVGQGYLGTPGSSSIGGGSVPAPQVATLQSQGGAQPQPVASDPTSTLAIPPTGFGPNAGTDMVRAATYQAIQDKATQYQLGSTELNPNLASNPETGPSNYLGILNKRASLYGVYPELQKVIQDNPDLLKMPASPADPRMAFDKSGKPIGRDVLSSIYNSPSFQELINQDPGKAAKLYSAVAGEGRSLSTDIAAKKQLLLNQQSEQQKQIDSIKGIEADPITGELTHSAEIHDPLTGNIKIQSGIPLTAEQKAAIQARGGVKAALGIDINEAGLRAKVPKEFLSDRSPQEREAGIQFAGQLMKQNPNMSASDALKATVQRFAQVDQKRAAANAPSFASQTPSISEVLSNYGGSGELPALLGNIARFGGNAFAHINNVIPRTANAIMAGVGSRSRVPLIPTSQTPFQSPQMRPEEAMAIMQYANQPGFFSRAGAGFLGTIPPQ